MEREGGGRMKERDGETRRWGGESIEREGVARGVGRIERQGKQKGRRKEMDRGSGEGWRKTCEREWGQNQTAQAQLIATAATRDLT